jgi:hypothetical protein
VAISALSRLDKRGGSRVVTNAGRDVVDAAASGAMRARRAVSAVSERRAQDDRRCSVRQNRVVLAPVAGVKLSVANSIQPDRLRHQAGSDGGKRNSSPGRARHKPSTHCAGDAGVLRLYLYACVRNSLHHCTRDRGCSKHPAFPAPSRLRDKGSGKPRAQCVARTRDCTQPSFRGARSASPESIWPRNRSKNGFRACARWRIPE